jgi:hypothetical protein
MEALTDLQTLHGAIAAAALSTAAYALLQPHIGELLAWLAALATLALLAAIAFT